MESNMASESGSDVQTVICSSTPDPFDPPGAAVEAFAPPPAEVGVSSETLSDEQAARALSIATATAPASMRLLSVRKVILLVSFRLSGELRQ
jgi:hypothetical protein